MKALQNEFSWSFSRHSTFQECRKKYWYQYYGSWNGWPLHKRDSRKEVDPLASYLYQMKQIQSFPMYVGTVVHESIEAALKKVKESRKKLDLSSLLDDGLRRLRGGLQDSEKEAWRQHPKKHANLFEHYYGNLGFPVFTPSLQEGEEKVRRCLTHWFQSPIVQNLILHPKTQWTSVEKLQWFFLGGIYKVFIVMDFCASWPLPNGEKLMLIFDWKTGKETEKTFDQLLSYALYAQEAWQIPLDRMILTPFYLDSNMYEKIGYDQETTLSAEKIQTVKDFITASCQEMLSLVSTPQPEKSNVVRVTDCVYTEHRKKCDRCPFAELCQEVEYQNLDEVELKEAVESLSL